VKLSLACQLAEHLVRTMEPHCQPDSVRVVGSVRQGKPTVKDNDGKPISTPRESDVFAALGLSYIEPGERVGYENLRA
jgi:DNA polymerase/3'-5' exonuclease PolX